MNNLVKSVKAIGGIGVVGFFLPQDPGAADAPAKKGQIALDFGRGWYNRKLRDLITAGKAKPSIIISHELPLAKAPDAYKNFDNRKDGWSKVVLKPAA